MPNSSIRTVLLFGLIAVVLGGIVVGGVRIIKARDVSYASASAKAKQGTTPQVTQKSNNPQPAKSQSQSAGASSTASNTQNSAPAQPTAPAPSAPSTSSTSTSSAPTPSQQDSLPKTYAFSPSDFGGTVVLMGLAAYFGSKLLRARANLRHYMNS